MLPRRPRGLRGRRLRRATSISGRSPKLKRYKVSLRDRVLARRAQRAGRSRRPSGLPLLERLRARRAMQGNRSPRQPVFRSHGERVVAAVVGCAVAAIGITFGLSRIPASPGNAQVEIRKDPVPSPEPSPTTPSPKASPSPSRVPSPTPDPGPQTTP